jgi:hypothetical protein
MEQELLTLPGQLSSSLVASCCSILSFLCSILYNIVCSFVSVLDFSFLCCLSDIRLIIIMGSSNFFDDL